MPAVDAGFLSPTFPGAIGNEMRLGLRREVVVERRGIDATYFGARLIYLYGLSRAPQGEGGTGKCPIPPSMKININTTTNNGHGPCLPLSGHIFELSETVQSTFVPALSSTDWVLSISHLLGAQRPDTESSDCLWRVLTVCRRLKFIPHNMNENYTYNDDWGLVL